MSEIGLRALTDWTDIDLAEHELARSIGLMPAESEMSDAKWVYWSNNPLGNELVVLLDRLTTLGFLEKRDEPDFQYRVRPEFSVDLGIAEVWQRARKTRSPFGLTLVVLRCEDLERSRQFYEALGLSLRTEQHGTGPRHYSARVGETVLELYPAGTESSATVRLGISVADVDAVVGTLRSLGDFITSVDRKVSPVRALVQDPDGNKIELTERGPL